MPRGPDKKRRRVHPHSLAQLQPQPSLPDHESITVRVYALRCVGTWFKEMSAADRGKMIQSLMPRAK